MRPLDPAIVRRVLFLFARGYTQRQIAGLVKVSRGSVQNILNAHCDPDRPGDPAGIRQPAPVRRVRCPTCGAALVQVPCLACQLRGQKAVSFQLSALSQKAS